MKQTLDQSGRNSRSGCPEERQTRSGRFRENLKLKQPKSDGKISYIRFVVSLSFLSCHMLELCLFRYKDFSVTEDRT